jgi:hypothetical protein
LAGINANIGAADRLLAIVAAGADDDSAPKGKYPWWAFQIKAMLPEEWDWLLFGLAEKDPLKAKQIDESLTYLEIATAYAMKAYHDSWEPEIKRNK